MRLLLFLVFKTRVNFFDGLFVLICSVHALFADGINSNGSRNAQSFGQSVIWRYYSPNHQLHKSSSTQYFPQFLHGLHLSRYLKLQSYCHSSVYMHFSFCICTSNLCILYMCIYERELLYMHISLSVNAHL